MDSCVLVHAEPNLQGVTLEFRFEDHDVKVSLPKLPSGKSQEIRDQFMEAEAYEWDKHGEILRVCVYAIRVTILRLRFELPTAAAINKGINVTLYSEDERKHLDERTDALYFLARRALKYWLEVLRWKTGLALIDFDTRPSGPSLRGARLINLAHGVAFYSPRVTRTLTGPKMHRLDLETWQTIADLLAAGINPPIWNNYLMSAQRRIEFGDYRAASIELAIAAESIMRRFFDKVILPSAILPIAPKWAQKKIVDPKMSELLERWTQFGFPDKTQLTWFNTIDKLTKVRNGIMHSGEDPEANTEFCRCAASAVEHLITLLESRLL
jgi:hypothetical protein